MAKYVLTFDLGMPETSPQFCFAVKLLTTSEFIHSEPHLVGTRENFLLVYDIFFPSQMTIKQITAFLYTIWASESSRAELTLSIRAI